MRKLLANLLYNWMAEDPDVVVFTADLGFKYWDEIKGSFPDRFYNVGAAEQLLLGCGIGAALEGKKPILYSITPFILWRPYELIRNFLDNEKVPVKLIGCGFENDYEHDGFSHYGGVEHKFKNIEYLFPSIKEDLESFFNHFKQSKNPVFLCVRR